mgnify:CR=1 FL=1
MRAAEYVLNTCYVRSRMRVEYVLRAQQNACVARVQNARRIRVERMLSAQQNARRIRVERVQNARAEYVLSACRIRVQNTY